MPESPTSESRKHSALNPPPSPIKQENTDANSAEFRGEGLRPVMFIGPMEPYKPNPTPKGPSTQ